MKNKALRGTIADFERVRRAFGPEQVEAAEEAAKQRKQAEKARKKNFFMNIVYHIISPITSL